MFQGGFQAALQVFQIAQLRFCLRQSRLRTRLSSRPIPAIRGAANGGLDLRLLTCNCVMMLLNKAGSGYRFTSGISAFAAHQAHGRAGNQQVCLVRKGNHHVAVVQHEHIIIGDEKRFMLFPAPASHGSEALELLTFH